MGCMRLRRQNPAEMQTTERRGISCTREFVVRDSYPPPREPWHSAISKACLTTQFTPLVSRPCPFLFVSLQVPVRRRG